MAQKHTIEISLVLKNEIDKAFEQASKAVRGNIDNIKTSLSKLKSDATQAFDGLKNAVVSASGSMGQFAQNIGVTGKGLVAVAGTAIAVTAGVIGIGKALAFAYDKGSSFEQSLANLRAILQASPEDMAKLSQQALFLGETTKFSADEAANAFTELGKLGLTTNQIIASSDAVLSLASASGIEMAESATIVASTLAQFQKPAEDANAVVDLMATAFNKTALDALGFKESMKVVGPVAKSVGVSLVETTSALGVLSNNAIQGSIAGTGLRRVLSELGDKGSDVNKVLTKLGVESTAPLSEKFKALRDNGFDVTSAVGLFGREAATVAQVLVSQADSMDSLNEEFKKVDGSAKLMADTMSGTTQGTVDNLMSAFDSLGIAIFETFKTENQDLLSFFIEKVVALSEFVKRNADTFTFWFSVIGEVVKGSINFFLSLVETIEAAFKAVAAVLLALAGSLLSPFETAFNAIANGYNVLAKKIGATPIEFDFVMGKNSKEGAKSLLEESGALLGSAFTRMTTGAEVGKGTQRVKAEGGLIKNLKTAGTGDVVGGMDLLDLAKEEKTKKKKEKTPEQIAAEQNKEAMAYQDKVARANEANQQLEDMQIQFSIDLLEAQDRHFEAELAKEELQFAQKKMQLVKNNESLEQLEALHQQSVTNINERENKRRKDNELKLLRERAQAITTFTSGIQDLLSVASSKNKALATVSKGIAIGEATVNTYLGATKALGAYPPPYGAIAAAGVIASGLASVAKISGVKFADGGIVPGSSLIGDRVPAMLNSGEMVLNKSQQRNLFKLANSPTNGGGVTIEGANIVINGNANKNDIRSALNEANDDMLIKLAKRMRQIQENGIVA